jgi:DNA invertase Pin-like site-specific DNA recombinase/predicted metal-binding protein
MKIVAYSYTNPLFETAPDPMIWGWEVDQIYQDLGSRQQLEVLLQDCQTEEIDYLLIRRYEELGDSLQAVSQILTKIEKLNINIIAIDSDVNSSIDRVKKSDVIQLFAEIQRSQRSRRICEGHARNRLKAVPPPGKAPYGYRRGKDKYIVDRSTAPVVKDFFERFLIYGSLRGSVRYLEQRYGKKISVTTGKRWLTNVVYRGNLEYKNGEVIPNTHLPIISKEEAAQVDRLLRRNQRMPPKTASAPRSLAGLVVCGECDCSMTISRVTAYRKSQEYLYLRPMNCPRKPKCKALSYEQVLAETIKRICQDLPQAVAALALPNLDTVKFGVQAEIAQKNKILDQLPQLIEAEILDEETAQIRAYKLRTAIAELQEHLAQLPPVNLKETAQAVSIPQFWLDLTETERRFYFREFIRQIEILRTGSNWQLKIHFIF